MEVMLEDLTGQVFNGIRVTSFSHKQGNRIYWNLVCSCGKERTPLRSDSLKKHTGICTCPIEKGSRYGLLTYKEHSHVNGKRSYCNVVCDCGKEFTTRVDSFKDNRSGCGTCPNKYTTKGDKIVLDVSTALHPNTFTTIDAEDYDKIKMHKWYAISGHCTTYVQASDGKVRISLHRLLLDCEEDLVTDHEDGNGLNNSKSNLRQVTRAINNKNLPKPINNTSGCIGVSPLDRGGYRAYITVESRQLHLGIYSTLEDAKVAREEAEVFYNFHENHGRA